MHRRKKLIENSTQRTTLRVATDAESVGSRGMPWESDMKDPWYFAYGSNLSIGRMEKRTGRVREKRRARLDGYRIAFNKKSEDGTGKANILPDPSGTVWGVIYRCSPRALDRMDQYEGVQGGHYTREEVRVRVDGGAEETAVTYIAGSNFINDSLAPSREYLQTILRGAHEHCLPEEYIRDVEALGTRTSAAGNQGPP